MTYCLQIQGRLPFGGVALALKWQVNSDFGALLAIKSHHIFLKLKDIRFGFAIQSDTKEVSLWQSERYCCVMPFPLAGSISFCFVGQD